MGETVLDIENLHVEFPVFSGSIHAVNGVSLKVAKGEIVGIVGESGSAKSVTAMTALRLLPKGAYRMPQGSIRLLGHDVAALGDRELDRLRGRDVAMIFQEPQTALNPTKKIGAQMTALLRLHTDLSGRQIRERALSLLKDMRINDAEAILERYPFELSGGMRQRILIAMAFACSPKLLIADEPTTALDVTVQRQVLQLMQAKARDTGAAVLFISHDLAVVSQFCDRIYVMYAGHLVETGPTKEVLRAPAHPYTQALIRALPESVAVGETLASIPGTVPSLINPIVGCCFKDRCEKRFGACEQKPALRPTDDPGRSVACWLTEEARP